MEIKDKYPLFFRKKAYLSRQIAKNILPSLH